MDFLTLLVFTIFLSLVLNLILKKFDISPIVGYILTGAIMAITLDTTSHFDKSTITHVAEFGIVFLMFTIGLEFSLPHLKSMKKEVFVYGSMQVILTTAIFGFIAHHYFGFSVKEAIVLGSALSLSSTAIVLKTLNDNGDIHRPYGRNTLGILLFQDLAVVPILLMISIFAQENADTTELVLDTLISGVIVFLILFASGRYVVNEFLKYVVKTKLEELFIAAILLLVLSASLLAHYFGFSYSLGAFVAGMLIAETKYKYKIESDLIPFRDILLGIFFISVGLQVDINVIYSNLSTIVMFTTAILVIKAIIVFSILWYFSFAKRAIKTALAIAQVGEFSFAVLGIAYQNNFIETGLHQILIAIIIISLIFTSLSVKHVRRFTDIFFKMQTESMREPIISTEVNHHVVVCGYSKLGQAVACQLKKKNITFMVIENDYNHVKTGEKMGDPVFYGNASSKNMLSSFNVKDSIAVIIAIDNDEKVRLICENIKAIDPNIPIVVKISVDEQLNDLQDFDIKGYINENKSVGKLLVSQAMKCDLDRKH